MFFFSRIEEPRTYTSPCTDPREIGSVNYVNTSSSSYQPRSHQSLVFLLKKHSVVQGDPSPFYSLSLDRHMAGRGGGAKKSIPLSSITKKKERRIRKDILGRILE